MKPKVSLMMSSNQSTNGYFNTGKSWIRTHHTSLNWKNNPFGAFYLMYKVHKNPIKARPVVSDCASVMNPLAKWVCVMFLPFAAGLQTDFKDSFELKKILDATVVPPGAKVFTCYASSMYTSIDTDAALSVPPRRRSSSNISIEDSIEEQHLCSWSVYVLCSRTCS